MMEIKKTWLGRYLNNLMRPTITVGFKCHIILVWTYVSSDIKGHFVFPNCQFRKRWFGPQQAKSKGWLWSLRPFLSLSFTAKCHRYQSVKWENIALAVQKLVKIRIARPRNALWRAILRQAILSTSFIRIARPINFVFFVLICPSNSPMCSLE